MTGLTLGSPLRWPLASLAGFLVGVLHFASLWWNTRLFTTGSAGKAIALQLARIAVAVARTDVTRAARAWSRCCPAPSGSC